MYKLERLSHLSQQLYASSHFLFPSQKMWQCLVFGIIFFLNLQITCSSTFYSSPKSTRTKLCSPEQSLALLQFKNSILINRYAPKYCYDSAYPKTNSWREDSDCCSWDGVTCDRLSGDVIGLDLSSSWLRGTIDDNSSLFLLHHLQRLNLACNYFWDSKISSKFGWFTKLTHLNLSSSRFYGQVPTEISQLSKLISLDLSTKYYELKLEQHSFNKVLQNLTELKYLLLDGVNMSSIVPASLANVSSLISLNLRDTALNGEFPNNVFFLPFLQLLRLSRNPKLKGNLPMFNWSSPLKLLDLTETGFSGKLPTTIGNLIHLEELDLSYCNFEGSIPTSLGNLTRINVLRLSSNGFTGQVPATIFNLTHVSSLDLSYNQLEGLPYHISSPSNLVQLRLSSNFLTGRLPSWLFTLPSLEVLDLGNNNLTGSIDQFQMPKFEPVNLTFLDLSSNNLSGIFESEMFSKLNNLEYVDHSHNKLLPLRTHDNISFTLPMLQRFHFSSCSLTEFPVFLRNSKYLTFLDLSANRITGQISQRDTELWHTLVSLNLSYNALIRFDKIPSKYLELLDLRSNLLQGPLSVMSPSMRFLLVSHNKFTGEIPPSFCNFGSLQILDLSNNSLSGMIPQCVVNWSKINILDLRMNKFNGIIPQIHADMLETLNLNGNQLEGPLPPSIASCRSLKVLDVGNNGIHDTFPQWLETLPKLQVLILRSNRFCGPIDDSKTIFPFPELRIVDISHNGFTGLLPTRFFENFKAMTQEKNDGIQRAYYDSGYQFYQYSTFFTMKGIEIEMVRVLIIFTTMDLSNNQFEGQIPELVGKLNSLKVLNFSHNHLAGYIPSSLENLIELESLDLSANKLIGEIPMQLINLKFISKLNLSYNRLVGPIPHGKQFNTFENNSYIGNLGLCGLPLSETCNNDEAAEPVPSIFPEEYNSWSFFDRKIIMMGYASGLVIGFSIGYIVISTGKPQWFIKVVERAQLIMMRRVKKFIG